MEMRRLARRSITALRDIKQGEGFTEDNVGLRRPGDGLAPKLIHMFWGQTASKSIVKGTQLRLGDSS
jgi:sialic acid synthase SpsE